MRAPSRQSTLVVALALLGLVLAVGVALLASRISAQHIGVAAESPGLGARLVAPPTTQHHAHSAPSRTTTVTVTVPITKSTTKSSPSPPLVPVVPVVPVTPSTSSVPPAGSGSGDDSGGGQGDD